MRSFRLLKTNLEAFILYHTGKYFIKVDRRKIINILENDEGFTEFIENTIDEAPPILIRKHTALFTSRKRNKKNNPIANCLFYRRKIKCDFLLLYNKGYSTIIVNVGTPYGMFALKVLVKLWQEYSFELLSSKIFGQRFKPLYLSEILLTDSCDRFIRTYSADEYTKMLLFRKYRLFRMKKV